jgi:hypothetical protein
MEMLKTMLASNTKTMLAEMKANQAKADADRKTDQEQMNANNKRMLAEMMAKMDAHQARMEAEDKAWREEIRAETEATQARTKAMREERMKTNRDACMADIENDRKETTACQDVMEANVDKIEPNPGEKKAAAERQETPNEAIAVHTSEDAETRERPAKRRRRYV